MAINLTNEESMVLSKLAYMNIEDEDKFKKDFKGKTLKEMAKVLVNEKQENPLHPREFGSFGSLTDKEQYAMLTDIVNDKTGKYANIGNLQIKDYDNQNDSNGFVAYAFSDGKDTVCTFRGSEGNAVGDDGVVATVNGKTGVDWIDNFYIGVRDSSSQFKPIDEFMKRNMVEGGHTFVTGHSKGAANAAYAAANFDGVTGFSFDGPGIGQCLSLEQIERLKASGFVNCVDQDDPVGALLFHPEKRIFSKHFEVYKLDYKGNSVLDKKGNDKIIKGIFAGHYTQGVHFDPISGEIIPGDRSIKSIGIEAATKATWLINEKIDQPLGTLVDNIKSIKTLAEIIGIMDSDISNVDKFKKSANKIIDLVKGKIEMDIDSMKVGIQRVKDIPQFIYEDILKKLGEIIIDSILQLANKIIEISEKIGNALYKFAAEAKAAWEELNAYVKGVAVSVVTDIVVKGIIAAVAIKEFKDKTVAKVSSFFTAITMGIELAIPLIENHIINSINGKNGSALNKFSKTVVQGTGSYNSSTIAVNLLQLEDLRSKMRNLEHYFGESVNQILNEANRVTNQVGGNYKEYNVQQQIHSINMLCNQISGKGRSVCESLERKASSLRYALEDYRKLENLLCSEINKLQ